MFPNLSRNSTAMTGSGVRTDLNLVSFFLVDHIVACSGLVTYRNREA